MKLVKPDRIEVFKIQRPMFPPDGEVLIYNKSRSHYGQFPNSPELMKLFGAEMKIYVRGNIGADGMLNILEKVKPQNW